MRVMWNGKTYDLPYRDSQVSKVYRAEHSCFRRERAARELRNRSQYELQAMADAIFQSDYVQDMLRRGHQSSRPAPRIKLVAHDARWATGSQYTVTLPPWAMNIHTFLHELCHAIAPNGSGHSWMFCAIMLEVVRGFLGEESAQALEAYYTRLKVRYTPQKRHEVRDRMAADRK